MYKHRKLLCIPQANWNKWTGLQRLIYFEWILDLRDLRVWSNDFQTLNCGLKGGSAVKSTGDSCRGPGLHCQRPQGRWSSSMTTVPKDGAPSGFHGHAKGTRKHRQNSAKVKWCEHIVRTDQKHVVGTHWSQEVGNRALFRACTPLHLSLPPTSSEGCRCKAWLCGCDRKVIHWKCKLFIEFIWVE